LALTFPSDLSSKYYFDLKFMTYSRPNPFSSTVNLSAPAKSIIPGAGGAAPATLAGSNGIRLPIPGNLVNTQKLDWQQANNVGGVAEAGFYAVQGKGDSAAGALARSITGMVKQGSDDVSSMLWGQAGNPLQFAMQLSGLAMNPVLTQMFKNPEFKVHQFSWTLAPESDEETYVLQEIIDTINENALPDTSAGGAFFTYPSIAMVQIVSGAYGNLYNIQPAVVTSVTANFTPKGMYAPFVGTNGPVEVSIDLTLLEIVLNTRSNYKGGNVSGFDFTLGGALSSAVKTLGLQAIEAVL
jgi:hypothetical protein